MPKNERSIDQETLLHGYSHGIFPMAEHRNAEEVFWVRPSMRAIIPLGKLHISRSLKKKLPLNNIA